MLILDHPAASRITHVLKAEGSLYRSFEQPPLVIARDSWQTFCVWFFVQSPSFVFLASQGE
jgi:hypothetical protein